MDQRLATIPPIATIMRTDPDFAVAYRVMKRLPPIFERSKTLGILFVRINL